MTTPPLGADTSGEGEEREPDIVVSLEEIDPGNEWGELSARDVRMVRALKSYGRELNVELACEAAGVTRDTWYRWKRNYPGFADVVERIKDLKVDEVEDAFFERAKQSSDVAAKDILKAYRPQYKDKQVIEVVSPDVQNRLMRQADTIAQFFQMELPNQAPVLLPKLAEKLKEIWS